MNTQEAPVIKSGAVGRIEQVVEDRHCTQRGAYKIFSTPNMVQFLENAAIEALKPVLGENRISVGTMVEVRHLAPTPVGMRVAAEAVVRQVEGARVVFDVELSDGFEKVGVAVHERYVLDMDRYFRRLEKKIAVAQDIERT